MELFLNKYTNVIALSIVLLFGLAYLDYVTGYDLGFFVFYFIPVSICAWYAGRPSAIVISFLAAITWLLVDQYSQHPYSHWSYPYWNAIVRCTSFVVLALAISQIKYMLKREERLKIDLSHALDRINQHVAVAKKVAEGDFFITTPEFANTEPVDKSFNFMIKRLLEQKRLEKRLFELERHAIIAETASHLAHEIRNPLNLIMLTAHHIGTQFVPSDESKVNIFKELIVSLKTEVEHLSSVVSNFMVLGKPFEIKMSSFPIEDIIGDIQILVKQQLHSKHITLKHDGTHGMTMFADPEQIKLVFLNLVMNSIAAVSENGTISISAALDMVAKKMNLVFADDGIGINSEDVERIFEPYFTRKSDGTGLGLALVKRIIEEHEGSIFASNNENGGARFEITLPLGESVCQ